MYVHYIPAQVKKHLINEATDSAIDMRTITEEIKGTNFFMLEMVRSYVHTYALCACSNICIIA